MLAPDGRTKKTNEIQSTPTGQVITGSDEYFADWVNEFRRTISEDETTEPAPDSDFDGKAYIEATTQEAAEERRIAEVIAEELSEYRDNGDPGGQHQRAWDEYINNWS